jgi:hypothetical protein
MLLYLWGQHHKLREAKATSGEMELVGWTALDEGLHAAWLNS